MKRNPNRDLLIMDLCRASAALHESHRRAENDEQRAAIRRAGVVVADIVAMVNLQAAGKERAS